MGDRKWTESEKHYLRREPVCSDVRSKLVQAAQRHFGSWSRAKAKAGGGSYD